MPLVIISLTPASNRTALNEEWILLENTGTKPVHTRGCAVTIGRKGQRPRSLGTLEPGFTLQPGEKIRVVTGSPAKKDQGAPPDETDVKNYHLFLKEALLSAPGVVVQIALNQRVLATATFQSNPAAGAPAAGAPDSDGD
jgi:hypothetical protein